MSNPSCPFPAGSVRAAVWHYYDDWTAYLPEAQQVGMYAAAIRDEAVIEMLSAYIRDCRQIGTTWHHLVDHDGLHPTP